MAEPQVTLNSSLNPSAGSRMVDNLTALPVAKQVGLVIALAATLALIVGILFWAQSKPYTLLLGSLEAQEMSEILQQLDQEAVPYKLDSGSGAILVPTEQVHALRIKLAAAGYPKQAATGYQLLDGDQGFGISQFKETTQYHRALEGELAKSVASINAVKSARVMLGLPKRSVFVRKEQKPTASVVVQLHAGRSLNEEQVSSIVYLVSSSIPNMEPTSVTVVDQNGNLLTDESRTSNSMLHMSMKQLDYTRQVEQTLSNRIVDLLAPIVGGVDKVRAQVTADLDFTQEELTRENYQPDPNAVRSEQQVREINREQGPAGVPGALTNQPPRAGLAPEESYNPNTDPNVKNSSEKTTRNYELDRTISHVKNSIGSIRRLSVAVVLDDKITLNTEGTVERLALSEEELQRYRQLVSDTVALDEARGDTLTVVNASFAVVSEEQVQATPIWQESWFWELVKQLLAGLAVLIILLVVVRPLLRELTQREKTVLEYPEEVPQEIEEIENIDEISKALEQMNEEVQKTAASVEAESKAEHELLDKVRSIVEKDPKVAAHVLRQWINSNAKEGRG
ncbi:MAG: flagellar M-ring protein FliF [Thiotrichales bacterium]|nr:flagellar M-ring protein FliF [Thiotrichales bacterium]